MTGTIVDVDFAIFSGVTRFARARVDVNAVIAAAVIRALLALALVDVCFAVGPSPASVALARELGDAVDADAMFGAGLVWLSLRDDAMVGTTYRIRWACL